MSVTVKKNILLIDDAGFSAVCSAILKVEGYSSETISDTRDLAHRIDNGDFGLIITSYPFAPSLPEQIRDKGIPVIVLSDAVSNDLLAKLKRFHSSYCMVKPLDYQKFRSLISDVIQSRPDIREGYAVV